jgi:hypothetical protein
VTSWRNIVMAISGLPRMTRNTLRSMPAILIQAPWSNSVNNMNPLGPTWGSTCRWYESQSFGAVTRSSSETGRSPISASSAAISSS